MISVIYVIYILFLLDVSEKVHSSLIFQDEWLYNKKYQLWIAKADFKNARCILCQKDLDVNLG